MRNWRRVLLATLAGLLISSPLLAHHSFSAEFDSNKFVSVTGVLTKVDYVNPHAYFYVDAKDDNGNVVHWAFESFPPGTLRKEGLSRIVADGLIGKKMTVKGYHAKDGSQTLGWAHEFHTEDGFNLIFSRDYSNYDKP